MQRLADLLVGPSMDNRVGLALIDALLGTENLACEVWLGATAQEENGLHGARALALAERFALDVGLVGDIPSATRSGREPHGRLRPSRDDGMTTGTRSRKVPVFLDTSADGAENGAWRLWTDAHHGRAVLRSNLDIGLAWGLAWSIGIREEFEEPWLQNLADRKAFCQYVDVLWRGYPVIRERYLTVDGGRYVIPLPDQTFEHIDASSYALMPLTITWWSHALGHLIHSLSGAMYEYDRGLRHARVEVADETDAANGSRDRL